MSPPAEEKKDKDPEPVQNDGDDELDRLLKSDNLLAMIPKDLSGKDKIQHADDALDFESEDELADEEEVEETAEGKPDENEDEDDWTKDLEGGDELADIFGDTDMNVLSDQADLEAERAATEEARRLLEAQEKQAELAQLQQWYPQFEEHTILNMNQMFAPEPSQTQLPQPKTVKPLNLARIRIDLAPDQAQLFVAEAEETAIPTRSSTKPVISVNENYAKLLEIELGRSKEVQKVEKPQEDATELEELQLEVSNWDDVLNAGESDVDTEGQSHKVTTSISQIQINDDEIYSSDEETGILDSQPLLKRTKLDLNDARLMFVEDRRSFWRMRASNPEDHPQQPSLQPLQPAHEQQQQQPHEQQQQTQQMQQLQQIQQQQKRQQLDQQLNLNISNDRAYDMLRANYQRKVRSTIGSLNIDHAMPAVRLQSPFYKVRHSKSQLRSGHRQKFGIKPGTVVEFTPLKMRKRWKDKNRQTQELFARSSDLTLGDSGSVFLIEYSEEVPLVLSGFGMGSKLINYYRKASENDSHRPKRAVGETHVLEEQDKSTFWNFGFVEPGNVVPTLYNQMTRSPVFQHESNSTDFLLVKSTNAVRGVRYYLRSIPYLFVSGQLFPAVQIPGPHSRKVTAASKNRLRMVVYRVLNKNSHHRLQIRDVSSIFPDYNEVQNRQRLKEFMEYQRSGEDQGFWKVKPGDHVPTEAEIRNLITPEDIMLLESMRMGQQRLEDSEYSKIDDDHDRSISSTTTTTTTNPSTGEVTKTKTISGVQSGGGANGNSNATGTGSTTTSGTGSSVANDEALSLDEQLAPWNLSRNFINAVQGKAMLSLHGDGDPTSRGEGYSFLRTSMKGGFLTEATAEEVKKLGGHSYNVAMQQKAYDEEIKRIWNAQRESLSVTDPKKLPDANKHPRKLPIAYQSGHNNKVLQITRVVKDENDVLVRQTELITDPLVINAYLRRRKAAEEERMAVDQISVTNDEEANKQRRKFLEQELARLNRNADRRHARKATKQDPKMKATTRKCATCGAVGHIKTNKSCPMYNDIYLNAAAGKTQTITKD